MYPGLDRVYVNAKARKDLGWEPKEDFGSVLERLKNGGELTTPLARAIGKKGYHDQIFEEGPFPTND